MGLVRLFLAYVVACDHWRVVVARGHYIPDWTNLGFNAGYAVMFFYIISGFLITHTLSVNYGPNDTWRFYGKRFIRIFSLYWPVALIVFAIAPSALTNLMNAKPIDQLTAVFLIGQDWNVSFGRPGGQYFGGNINMLNQSWTLGAELTFYLFAPWILRRPKIAAVILLASLCTRFGFVIANGPGPQQTWTYTFFPSSVCFFMFGYFAALAYNRYPSASHRFIYWSALPVMIAIMQFGPRPGFDSVRFWACVLLFTALLPSLFDNTKNSKALNAIGDLSYPLYLTHVAVMVKTHGWINSFDWATQSDGGRLAAMWVFAAIAIVASAVVSLIIEKPVAKAATWVWQLFRTPTRYQL